MSNYLEPIKVEQALRSEQMKLEYRKNNKPDDVNILDYTVIEALERQVPKKVLVHGLNQIYCPTCGNGNQTGEYCQYCGQHLKD